MDDADLNETKVAWWVFEKRKYETEKKNKTEIRAHCAGWKMLEASVGARGLVCFAEGEQSEFVFAFIRSYSRLRSIFCSIKEINTSSSIRARAR